LSISPITGQLIGFITLTLPVVAYSYLTEKSAWKGTVGKRVQKLIVSTDQNISGNILLRNILKYLPWELAHTGVQWTIYYASKEIETPLWVWSVLVFPQIIVIGYLISIVISKGRSSLYDNIARTKIAPESIA
jgi:hypothetical protein